MFPNPIHNTSTSIKEQLHLCEQLFEQKSNQLLEACDKLIELAQGQTTILAKAYYWRGHFFVDSKVFKKAIENFKSSLQYYHTLQDTDGISIASYHLARIRYHIGLYDKKTEELLSLAVEAANSVTISTAQKVDCLDMLGVIALVKNNLSKSKAFFDKALYYADLENLSMSKVPILLHYSYVHNTENQLIKAFKLLDEGMKLTEELGAKEYLLEYYIALSGYYSNMMDFERAEELTSKAIEIGEKNQQTRKLSGSYSVLANIYRTQKKLDKALQSANKALEILTKAENQAGKAYSHVVIGEIMCDKGEYEQAIAFYNKSYEHNLSRQQPVFIAEDLSRIALAYLHLGNYQKSIELGQKALEIYPEIKEGKSKIHKTLSAAYEHLGNYEKAHQYLKTHLQKKEDIEEKNQKELSIIRRQYETELREKETELLQLKNQELEELNALKTRFFTNISHELRTPLTLILGPANVLLSNNQSSEDRRLIETIQRSGNKILHLVEEVLDLSKLESGKLELQEKPTAFYPYIRRIFNAFRSGTEIKEQKYELSYWMDEDVSLQIDRKKLEKMLNNLLSNAIKYTPQSGKIQMLVEEAHDNSLQIRVKDSGRGIHKNDQPHIFERYFQSNQKDVSLEGGTGIGLALVKEFAELMNGKVQVQSKLGKGSIFTLQLPLKKAKVVQESIALDEKADSITVINDTVDVIPSSADTQFTVLLVEDHFEMQQYIRGILSENYQLKIASNGKVAWGMLQNKKLKIDLIVSDVMMPEMDGFTLLEKLKQDKELLQIPVVMLTARSDIKDKLKALTLGVDDYLLKPFVAEELQARISNLLYRYRAKKKLEVEETEQVSSNLQLEENTISKKSAAQYKVLPSDLLWIQNVEQKVRKEVNNFHFSMSELAIEMNLSDRQFQRKIKKITGLSPVKYTREIRLQMAREILEKGECQSVGEVAYAVGFDTPHYFGKLYEKRFGKRVGDYFH